MFGSVTMCLFVFLRIKISTTLNCQVMTGRAIRGGTCQKPIGTP